METLPRYIRTESVNGKIYWKPPPEVYSETCKRYYEGNKGKIIRQKILKQLEVNGRVPTKTSCEKYEITPAEMMSRYEIFRTDHQDDNKVKDKVMKRISEKWA
jgi:hypothetical protein